MDGTQGKPKAMKAMKAMKAKKVQKSKKMARDLAMGLPRLSPAASSGWLKKRVRSHQFKCAHSPELCPLPDKTTGDIFLKPFALE